MDNLTYAATAAKVTILRLYRNLIIVIVSSSSGLVVDLAATTTAATRVGIVIIIVVLIIMRKEAVSKSATSLGMLGSQTFICVYKRCVALCRALWTRSITVHS